MLRRDLAPPPPQPRIGSTPAGQDPREASSYDDINAPCAAGCQSFLRARACRTNDICGSNPVCPATQSALRSAISGYARTADISPG
jgi:hypothetical protein